MPQSMPPDPTAAEVLSYRPFATGRISIVFNALKRILLEVAKPAIVLENANMQAAGVKNRYPLPLKAFVAPATFGKDDFPFYGVAASRSLANFTPLQSETNAYPIIYLAYNNLLSELDVMNCNDVLDIVAAALYPYRGGHCDALGNKVWDSIVPVNVTYLTGLPDWKDARGFALHLEMKQFPGSPRWNLPT